MSRKKWFLFFSSFYVREISCWESEHVPCVDQPRQCFGILSKNDPRCQDKMTRLTCARTCGACRGIYEAEYEEFMRHVPDNEQCMRLESANLDCGHFCAKENGIPVCKCKVGYRQQDNECIEIDECASYEWNRNVWEFPCKDNELCENHAGSFTCIDDPWEYDIDNGCPHDPQKDPEKKKIWRKYKHSDSLCCMEKKFEDSTCGVVQYEKTTRIIGGHKTDESIWPWFAYLKFEHPSDPKLCGGTFITEEHILTAYHCVNKHIEESNWSKIEVIAGKSQYTGLLENDVSPDFHTCEKVGREQICYPQSYKVIGISIHPESKENKSENADLAILKVQKKGGLGQKNNNFSPVPICLPKGEVPPVGKKCFIVGHGYKNTRNQKVTKDLLAAGIPIQKDEACSKIVKQLGSENDFYPERHVCAGYQDGTIDACNGDSGGPLMCQRANSCEWYIAGLVSYGFGCGESFSVYTEINYFADWIEQKIEQTRSIKKDEERKVESEKISTKKCAGEFGHKNCQTLKFEDKFYEYDVHTDSYLFHDKEKIYLKENNIIVENLSPKKRIAIFIRHDDQICHFDIKYGKIFRNNEWTETKEVITCAKREEIKVQKNSMFTIDLQHKDGLLLFTQVKMKPEIYFEERNNLILKYSEDVSDGAWIIKEASKKDNEFICGNVSSKKDNFLNALTMMWCKQDTGKGDWFEVKLRVPDFTIRSSQFGLLTFTKTQSEPTMFFDEKNKLTFRYSQINGLWIILQENKNDNEFICAIDPETKDDTIFCKLYQDWEKIDIQRNQCEPSIGFHSPKGYLKMKKLDISTYHDETKNYTLFYLHKFSQWIIAGDKDNRNSYICGSKSGQEQQLHEVFQNLYCFVDGKYNQWTKHDFQKINC